jgi:hypothetical protein
VLHPLPPALSRTGPDPCRAQIRASAAKQCSLSGMCHSDSKQYSLVTHRAMSVSIWASDASILASDAESSISKNPSSKVTISKFRRRSNKPAWKGQRVRVQPGIVASWHTLARLRDSDSVSVTHRDSHCDTSLGLGSSYLRLIAHVIHCPPPLMHTAAALQ